MKVLVRNKKLCRFQLKSEITKLNGKSTLYEWAEMAFQQHPWSTSPKKKETEKGCEKDGLRPKQAYSLQK